jgi:molybdopterin molybdotransferase
MRGQSRLHRMTVPVTLDEAVSVAPELTHFLRVVITARGDGTTAARLTGTQSSGVLSSMARANALAIVPRGMGEVAAGTSLRAIPLGPEARETAEFSL